MPEHYTLGPARYQSYARLRTKPSSIDHQGRRDTGGGYERFRSYEVRPDTPRDGAEDVYVAHHRLLAVVACYPEDMPVSDILAHLEGKDVHHKSGVEWDNRPSNLVVREHGRHAHITQTQMRAWAEDAKETAEAIERGEHPEDRCDSCGTHAKTLAESDDWQGVYCLDCAFESSDGSAIEVS